MKVKDLIEQLKQVDADKEIKICPVEEGNNFKKIDCVDEVNGKIIIYPFG